MDRYDKDELKLAAQGQWKSIVASVGSVDLNVLDGRHHPCPKCGGSDRFRMLDQSTGALYCNQCFSTKNGDGIAAVMWLLDCDFKTAMAKIGQHLNLTPKKKSRTKNPAAKLRFVEWNDLLAAGWCQKKKPITVDALKKIGAKMAMYRNQFKVIAIPVWEETPDNVVGWNLYNITGGTLPKFQPTGDIEQVKVKLTFGSRPGLMGFIDPDQPVLYKTEGPTDLLGLISQISTGSAICNANGAKENPVRSFGWLLKLIDGKEIRVVHDADEPGQHGALYVPSHDGSKRPGWAPWLSTKCEESTVKNILLPYEIEKTHGKDLRDWFNEGNDAAALELLSAETDAIEPDVSADVSDLWEADNDPYRLARINLKQYRTKHAGRLAFWQSEWWKYKAGRYQKIELSELKAKVSLLIRKEFERTWKEKRDPNAPVEKVTVSLVNNVINAMASMCSVSSSVKMPCWLPDRKKKNYLSFTNGILDLDAVFDGQPFDECLLEHTSDWFSTFRLDYEWNPEAECPRWLQYLDDVMECDDERINLLQEWAGYLLTNQNDHQKFLVLEGEGKNGKTVFFAAMTAMLGEDNVSHVSMESFGGRFDLGVTLGKAANISGDVGEIDQLAEGVLKQFTGGDTMQFDRKNLQPIQARPTAKLMAAWNQRPRIKDRSDGLWRRLLLVPFKTKVSEEKRVHGMDQPEWWIRSGESPGILLWAIAGLHRLKEKRQFTRCQVSIDAMTDYQIDSNPAAEFFNEYIEKNEHGEIESKKLYDLYQHWCKQVNCRPLGNRQFGKEIRRKFPYMERVRVKRDRKLFWHYKKIFFTVEEIFGEKVCDAELL